MTIEGIPEGWRLVRVGKVKKNEWRLSNDGNPLQFLDEQSISSNSVIIERIEVKP